MRRIFLEPVWKLPQSYQSWVTAPPSGYEVVESAGVQDGFFRTVSRWPMAYEMLWALDAVVPPVLTQAWLQKRRRPPEDSLLTYAHGHVVFRPEPWIVEVEYLSLLLGMDPRHLSTYTPVLERALASPFCRGIRCWSDAGKRSLRSLRNYAAIEPKTAVIPQAILPKEFAAEPVRKSDGSVRLLFVGSANIKGEFEMRGGREVLEAFRLLRARYPDLQLVMRSDLPPGLRAALSGTPGLRVIEEVIPWARLAQEFREADIFILPTHSTPPFVFLDAMSFGLPIVTLDAWANGEMVRDGQTGLLAQPSARLPYYYRDGANPNFGSRAFRQAIRVPDPSVVDALAHLVSSLIERPDLRRRMGRAARREVEQGNFSVQERNRRLGQFLGEALGEGRQETADGVGDGR